MPSPTAGRRCLRAGPYVSRCGCQSIRRVVSGARAFTANGRRRARFLAAGELEPRRHLESSSRAIAEAGAASGADTLRRASAHGSHFLPNLRRRAGTRPRSQGDPSAPCSRVSDRCHVGRARRISLWAHRREPPKQAMNETMGAGDCSAAQLVEPKLVPPRCCCIKRSWTVWQRHAC
jgi:hypothetical protein